MIRCLLLLCCLGWSLAYGQTEDSAEAGFLKYVEELNHEFRNPTESPLPAGESASFTEHSFFPFNTGYRLIAKVERLEKSERFLMATTTSRQPEYDRVYRVRFTLRDTVCVLYLYRNVEYASKPGNEDYLFLPFCDKTNGFDSYGGGRYIDLEAPKGEEMVIDFNRSYNPLCAYNKRYSCPVPPKENHLPIGIYAGIKYLPH